MRGQGISTQRNTSGLSFNVLSTYFQQISSSTRDNTTSCMSGLLFQNIISRWIRKWKRDTDTTYRYYFTRRTSTCLALIPRIRGAMVNNDFMYPAEFPEIFRFPKNLLIRQAGGKSDDKNEIPLNNPNIGEVFPILRDLLLLCLKTK